MSSRKRLKGTAKLKPQTGNPRFVNTELSVADLSWIASWEWAPGTTPMRVNVVGITPTGSRVVVATSTSGLVEGMDTGSLVTTFPAMFMELRDPLGELWERTPVTVG